MVIAAVRSDSLKIGGNHIVDKAFTDLMNVLKLENRTEYIKILNENPQAIKKNLESWIRNQNHVNN